jgi:predicted RNA binding protein with dsRBD fold (UPF0201 family)
MTDTGGASGSFEPTVPAGETGAAATVAESVTDAEGAVVVLGEIPDAEDLTHMLWTARCTSSLHDLLGTYPDQEMAEAARQKHLLEESYNRNLWMHHLNGDAAYLPV